MNERDPLCSSQHVLDISNGQQIHTNLNPDPCILLGTTSNVPQSHIIPVLPPSGFDFHHLPEHVGGPGFYGMPEYNHPNHHPITNQHNFFNLHMDFRVPHNHGTNVVPFNEHGRSNYEVESVREICKRKNTEASSGTSSSSVAPMEESLPLPDYRSGALGLYMDYGMSHTYNNNNYYLVQGNFGAHNFQASSCTWFDQHSMSGSGGLPWNGHPMLPYFHGNNIHGVSSEMGHANLPSYPERSNNHNSTNFLQSPPPVIQHPHNLHPSHNMQGGVRGYGVNCYPPFLAPPSRVPPIDNLQHDAFSASQEVSELTNRPTGIRIYRSQGRNLVPNGGSRHRDLPRLRTLPVDRVAILEFPNFYEMEYDIESFIDHHRDMRLDVDNMTYEDLLALGEQIGTVNTGLSEEDIRCHLKTRRYNCIANFNLEELPSTDQNDDSCIICQDEYEHNAKLASLECGHEYHVNCLKKWLLLKNLCPVCKSVALSVNK